MIRGKNIMSIVVVLGLIVSLTRTRTESRGRNVVDVPAL